MIAPAIALLVSTQAAPSDIGVLDCDAAGRHALVQAGSCTRTGWEGPVIEVCGTFLLGLNPPRVLERFDLAGEDHFDDLVAFARDALVTVIDDEVTVRWGPALAKKQRFPPTVRYLGAAADGALLLLVPDARGAGLARYFPGGKPAPFGPPLNDGRVLGHRVGPSRLVVRGPGRALLVELAPPAVLLDQTAETFLEAPDGTWFLGTRRAPADGGASELEYVFSSLGAADARARSSLASIEKLDWVRERGPVLVASQRTVEEIELAPLRVRPFTPFADPEWEIDGLRLSTDGRLAVIGGHHRLAKTKHLVLVVRLADLATIGRQEGSFGWSATDVTLPDGGLFELPRFERAPPPPRPACEAAALRAARQVLSARPDGEAVPK